MMEFTLYHKLLRISSVVLAVALVFQSGLFSSTTALMATQTQSYLANSVGVFVGVEPTELNTITAGLTEQKLALDARENELRQREIAVGIEQGGATKDMTTFIMGLVLFIVVLLLVLNYSLDYLRYRETKMKPINGQTLLRG
jgi:p-aminobenzoyl-glutamate transporter AbgT